jgi:hypothetical protein
MFQDNGRSPTLVESTAYKRFSVSRSNFSSTSGATGDRVYGEGRKVTENGGQLVSAAQTPISVDGTFDGDRLTLAFLERGAHRPTQGTFDLQFAEDASLRGAASRARLHDRPARRSPPHPVNRKSCARAHLFLVRLGNHLFSSRSRGQNIQPQTDRNTKAGNRNTPNTAGNGGETHQTAPAGRAGVDGRIRGRRSPTIRTRCARAQRGPDAARRLSSSARRSPTSITSASPSASSTRADPARTVIFSRTSRWRS